MSKLILEESMTNQLDDICLELDSIKSKMVFLRRVSETEDNSSLESLYLDEYNNGRANVIEDIEKDIEKTKSKLWQIRINEGEKNGK